MPSPTPDALPHDPVQNDRGRQYRYPSVRSLRLQLRYASRERCAERVLAAELAFEIE